MGKHLARTVSIVAIISFLLATMAFTMPAAPAAQTWDKIGPGGLGDTNNFSGSASIVYKGNLVVGTANGNGAMVYQYAGGVWVPMNQPGFGAADNAWIHSMIVYDGKLYAAVENDLSSPGGSLWRYDDVGTNWTMVASSMSLFGGSRQIWNFKCLAQGGGWLFVGCEISGYMGSFVFGFNGSQWTPVLLGTYDVNERHLGSLHVVGNYLYAGITSSGSAKVIRRDIRTISILEKPIDTQVVIDLANQWESSGFPGGGEVSAMTTGPNGKLVAGTKGFGALGVGVSEMVTNGTWNPLYSFSGNGGVTTLFWDGGGTYIFSTYQDAASPPYVSQVWQMTTEGKDAEAISEVGFGNPNSVEVASATSTFGVSGTGAVGAEVPNFFACTTNWSGCEVYSTRLDVPYPKWYFAEGYTGPGFDEWLTIQNPDAAVTADVLIEYMLNGEANPNPQTVQVPPSSRYTIKVNDVIGANHEVSALVMCTNGVDIIAERPMYFQYSPDIQGGHCVVGTRYPGTTWYFAEGYTAPSSFEYITLQNPGGTAASVKIDYFGSAGAIGTVNVELPGNSRKTVSVNDTVKNSDVSATVTSTNGVPIVAERPMYFWRGEDKKVNGGHCAVGAPSPTSEAYFGEGYTAPGWDTYLLLQNPNSEKVDVNITYLVKGTGAVPFTASLDPNTRTTFLVNNSVPVGSELGIAVVATKGILAERAMYFTYRMSPKNMGSQNLTGGHDCFGTVYGKEFLFAEGYTGTWWDEYLTLANPNNFEIKVMVEYMLEGGGNPAPVEVTIPANNRVTVTVKDTVAANKNVSCRLTSSSNFIAERPMYFWYEEKIAGGDCVMGFIPPTR